MKIVEAHKPNRDDERARIEALGGTIMHWGTWRVNGQLGVSRAIGKSIVSYCPFVRSFFLHLNKRDPKLFSLYVTFIDIQNC